MTSLKVSNNKSECVACAMKIIGSKWTALILQSLTLGPKRFGELETEVTGVNPRILSQRLSALEQAGIISHRSFNEVPPRSEYSLTPKGSDLLPVLKQMARWGEKYPD